MKKRRTAGGTASRVQGADDPGSETEPDEPEGEDEDAMEYDTDLIFKHL